MRYLPNPAQVLRHIALLALFLAATACQGESTLPTTDITIKDKKYTLEIASTNETRQRGLMYRDSMAKDHGMIFLFEKADLYPFWMHNTRIPLDIIWLDSEGKVVHIETMNPYDEVARGNKTPALYVIELNAGTAKAIGLKVDDKITLPEKVLKPQAANSEK